MVDMLWNQTINIYVLANIILDYKDRFCSLFYVKLFTEFLRTKNYKYIDEIFIYSFSPLSAAGDL